MSEIIRHVRGLIVIWTKGSDWSWSPTPVFSYCHHSYSLHNIAHHLPLSEIAMCRLQTESEQLLHTDASRLTSSALTISPDWTAAFVWDFRRSCPTLCQRPEWNRLREETFSFTFAYYYYFDWCCLFTLGLFDDCCSSSEDTASNNTLINEWRIGRWVEGSVTEPFSRYHSGIRLEELRRTTKNFNQDNTYRVSDSNQAPPGLTMISQMILHNVPRNC